MRFCRLFFTLFITLSMLVLQGCSTKQPLRHNLPPKTSDRPLKYHPKKNKYFSTIEVGRSPLSPLSADFNRDGFADIAVVSHGDNTLLIYWGVGNGKFRPGPVYGEDQVGYHPGKIALVDWNNDGLMDILLACEGTFQVQYWKNNGNGFSKQAYFKIGMNAKSIQCRDIDDDGLKDIVLGAHQGNYVMILWGTKNGFKFHPQILKGQPITQNVELGDWNNDGRTDIFWVEKRPGSVAVALNLGNRKFKKIYIKKPGIPQGIVKDGPEYVKIADLDEDGCQDAAVPLEVGKACYIYYGDCKGGVARTEKIPAPEWGYSGIAAVGRGAKHPPMLALGEEMKLFIATKTQKGWILNKKPAGSLPRDFIFTDLNGDGILDLLFANSASNTIGLLYGPF